MQYKTFPWNEWIDLLLAGDEAPFFEGLMRAVNAAACFRGKSESDIRREYGDEARDEIFSKLALKMLGGVIRMFRTSAYSDSHIAAYIMKAIKNMSADLYEKQQRERARFVALSEMDTTDDDSVNRDATGALWKLADSNPTPEAELESQELSNLLKKITAHFTSRQTTILFEYKAFGGEMSGSELAAKFGLSIQRINQEISTIRRTIRAAAVEIGYSPLLKGAAQRATSVANRELS